ncbi:UNKNOWN [Stylonychia lemnae]|uniref:Uncharacterized protein n=1 Tax=Stylonychia lemnae TaxID=5949 RepID=A0A078AT40_STYLE|nr:UNKNOWN [Stylonychia lemnae]|eukprot:CDW85354.1 UNKNOWN [Stylonychia lemnae]
MIQVKNFSPITPLSMQKSNQSNNQCVKLIQTKLAFKVISPYRSDENMQEMQQIQTENQQRQAPEAIIQSGFRMQSPIKLSSIRRCADEKKHEENIENLRQEIKKLEENLKESKQKLIMDRIMLKRIIDDNQINLERKQRETMLEFNQKRNSDRKCPKKIRSPMQKAMKIQSEITQGIKTRSKEAVLVKGNQVCQRSVQYGKNEDTQYNKQKENRIAKQISQIDKKSKAIKKSGPQQLGFIRETETKKKNLR